MNDLKKLLNSFLIYLFIYLFIVKACDHDWKDGLHIVPRREQVKSVNL